MITDTKSVAEVDNYILMSSDGFPWTEALPLITLCVFIDVCPRSICCSKTQPITQESTAAVRNCYSPITVAKTVKLRAELCRAAVCFPSFGM